MDARWRPDDCVSAEASVERASPGAASNSNPSNKSGLSALNASAAYVGGWRKRAFDAVLAALGLAALLPAFALIALAIKVQDGGPVFYGHERIGYRRRPFRCWKFRSMAPDAARRLAEVLAEDDEAAAEWKRHYKLRRDPRVTFVGGLLRRTSLDELPQLFNVLIGEMSLVGPRPVTEEELDRFGDAAEHYLAVRPGLSGLWQVSGRNDLSYETRVTLDARYVNTWKLSGDLMIILKTIPSMINGRGAY